ncbi:MAG TPA: SIS domain-containing protein [Planctomycetota bacterium]
MPKTVTALLARRLAEAQASYAALDQEFLAAVAAAAELAIDALRAGGGVYLIGNGGSAADAQHWAAELVGRYLIEREPLNVHALTVNSSTYTALVNDYPPEQVFERQVRAHVRHGDLLVAISTSGNSANILLAVEAARDRGARVVGVTGRKGGRLAPLCDVAVRAPSDDTPRIQEVHLLFGHLWCETVEQAFTPA